MKYANYEETTGRLLGWYDSGIHSTIPTPNIEVNEVDWQTALDNNYNYVDATTNTLSKKDFRTFAELQTAKLLEVKQAFTASLLTGYTCPTSGITMDADMNSISMLNSGYTLANAAGATTMNIRDYDNVVHRGVAIADVSTMLLELGQNCQVQLAKKWALEAKIKAATTQVALDAIVW